MLNITSGRIPKPQKVVIYGPEGIGKTTFAAQFPDPVFIDTEGSTYHMDVRRTPKPESWQALCTMVKEIAAHPGLCKTLVLDTADWAEMLCVSSVCAKFQKKGIEDFGYGKGYVYLQEEFGQLLNALTEVVNAGMGVVVTAHAKMRKFEQPDEMGSYDRWEMKLSKQVAPMVKEWADMVLFANYKTYVIATDKDGQKHKAQGGKRVMYTAHHPCWDAKNRHGLPDELPLDYGQIAQYIDQAFSGPAPALTPKDPGPALPPPAPVPNPAPAAETAIMASAPKKADAAPPPAQPAGISADIPPKLRPLMQSAGVTEGGIRHVFSKVRGYYPYDTPWATLQADGFVDGWILPNWEQIVATIKAEEDDLPF